MPVSQDCLLEGEELLKGQMLRSSLRKFALYMSRNGHVTLYRFEAGRDPINMWRFYCYHQTLQGDPRLGVRAGLLYGSDDRYSRQSGKVLWVRPADPNRRASNPILVVQDDGNVVLYSRDPQGNILVGSRNGWGSGTNGEYPAAVNKDLPVAMIGAGTIAINANTLIENTLPHAINVSDGRTAVILQPSHSIGAFSQGGPGTLAISVNNFAYDLENGQSSATPPPNIRAHRDGSTVRLVQGSPAPLERSTIWDDGWGHLQLPWDMEERDFMANESDARASVEAEESK